ncbi:MAG: DUF104 domain-containing protein [Candidatus Latescibacteria bacterium]|nr:DUF104 domain-containing protein [Candidatus Latescibacterota bacterium]
MAEVVETLTAVYDGQVLRPEHPVDLKLNARYVVTVEREVQGTEGQSAWDVLEKLVGSVEAPEDWAAEHDHYLYGTPKRHKESGS